MVAGKVPERLLFSRSLLPSDEGSGQHRRNPLQSRQAGQVVETIGDYSTEIVLTENAVNCQSRACNPAGSETHMVSMLAQALISLGSGPVSSFASASLPSLVRSGPTVQLHKASFALHEELARDLKVNSYRRIPVLSVQPGKRTERTVDLCPWLDGDISTSSLMDPDGGAQVDSHAELSSKKRAGVYSYALTPPSARVQRWRPWSCAPS